MGTAEEALKYLERRFYISLTGYLCKDKSDTGVRRLLEDGTLPLDRLLVETDAPFMYPNTRASKLPQHVKTGITERSLLYLHRWEGYNIQYKVDYLLVSRIFQILYLPTQRALQSARHRRDDSRLHEENPR